MHDPSATRTSEPPTPHGASASARNRGAQSLFQGLPARYDLLAELLSFGQNRRWRSALVDRVTAASPRSVLDVATGTGGVALALTRRGTLRVTGVDQSEPMLREAARRVGRHDPDRIVLVAGRAEHLPFPDGHFDAVSFTYLLRYVDDPLATLTELVRVVAPGGPVVGLDFAVPGHALWHAAWWCYTRIGLPAGGLLGGAPWVRVGRFLGPSISDFARRYPRDRLIATWREAGLVEVGVHDLSLGGGRVMWGVRGDG